MLDVLIKGGQLVDGTGTPSRVADVGIRGGRVVSIGMIDESASRTIDAAGMTLAPGFIDIHTHFDAQALWDPTMSPSSLHGVTSVIGGNCGFSIAPLRPETTDYLMRMLARVEGMPLAALQAGAPWDWTSTAEFLDRLEGNLAINAGFMVGHSAIRRVVMGEESIGHIATGDQLAEMVQLLREGLAAGGFGFSTSWGSSHQDAEGNPVPSRHAGLGELQSLAQVCGEYEGTSLEFVPSSGEFTVEERDAFTAMSAGAGRPLNWNSIRAGAESLEKDRRALDVGTWASERGGKVVGLAMPVDFPARYCFLTPFILDSFPGWAKPMALPVEDRIRVLSDPVRRRELNASAQLHESRFNHADWGAKRIAQTFTPETKRFEGRLVSDIAAESHKDAFDALLDIVCADRLRTTFSRVPAPSTPEDWAARQEIWRDPRSLIGGSDAGAHLDFTANFYYPTYMMGTVVRDEGVLSIEEAVAMVTARPADLYGLRDRGRLVPGAYADIVIFDQGTIGAEEVVTKFDLPSGAGRLFAGARGIERVMVRGEDVVVRNQFTDARPGQVLRSGQDTATPSMAF
jgi:N-acyl-D-aspartate/D-glutamate deacylase